jgi:hypothetical protein
MNLVGNNAIWTATDSEGNSYTVSDGVDDIRGSYYHIDRESK